MTGVRIFACPAWPFTMDLHDLHTLRNQGTQARPPPQYRKMNQSNGSLFTFTSAHTPLLKAPFPQSPHEYNMVTLLAIATSVLLALHSGMFTTIRQLS